MKMKNYLKKILNIHSLFLAKSKLNSIEVAISKALINSFISHDEFVLINNVLKEYNKEEIKNLKTSSSLAYLHNVIVLLEVYKKYRKKKSKI